MARDNFAMKLIEAAENGLLEWQTLASECVAYMSRDDCENVADALGLNDDEGDDEGDDELCDRCMRVVSEISYTEDGQTVCLDCAGE